MQWAPTNGRTVACFGRPAPGTGIEDECLEVSKDGAVCNHTSPGTGIESSPASEISLGSQIEAFIRNQRLFSEELAASSPSSMVSEDSGEVDQIIVDEGGLIMHVDLEDVLVEERSVVELLATNATQSRITDFYRRQNPVQGAAVERKPVLQQNLVSSNESQVPPSPSCEDD